MIRVRIKLKPKPVIRIPKDDSEISRLQTAYEQYYKQIITAEDIKQVIINEYFYGKTEGGV